MTHKDHLEVLRKFRANWGINKFCPPDIVGRINESLDYALSLLEKEEPPAEACDKCLEQASRGLTITFSGDWKCPHIRRKAPLPPIENLVYPFNYPPTPEQMKINEIITRLNLNRE